MAHLTGCLEGLTADAEDALRDLLGLEGLSRPPCPFLIGLHRDFVDGLGDVPDRLKWLCSIEHHLREEEGLDVPHLQGAAVYLAVFQAIALGTKVRSPFLDLARKARYELRQRGLPDPRGDSPPKGGRPPFALVKEATLRLRGLGIPVELAQRMLEVVGVRRW